MLEIRTAREEDYPCVRDFYYAIIDDYRGLPYSPAWKKDIYPSQDFLRASIALGQLRLGYLEGELAASMVINTLSNEGYRKVEWPSGAGDGEALVVHALGIKASLSGRGLAKEMVSFAINSARKAGLKAVRLDVLDATLPAKKAYEALGFVQVGKTRMYYDNTGWTDFALYELAL